MSPRKKLKLYIDAGPLVHDHFSGVGHSLLGIVRALEDIQLGDDSLNVTLFAPFMLKHRLNNWGFQWLDYEGVPLPRRVINGLQRRNALPPVDLILGKGIYFFPNFLSWRLAFSKSILLIHDISYELYPEFVDGPNQKFLSDNVPPSIARADLVASVSPSAKKEIEEFYNLKDDSVQLIPNAVDRSLFYRRDQKEIDYAKAQYGVIGEYFIFVGNLEPRKNIIRMIDAYKQLPKNMTDKIGLLIVGGGGWRDEEIKDAIIVARLEGFRILRPEKFVKDDHLPALYSGAKALIYSPLYEGFGMPPLEAMACGVPVVCSKVSSLPWVVGKSAIMIDPASIDSITKGIQDALDPEKTKKLVKKGFEQIEKFNWYKSAQILVDYARSLQGENK